MERRFAGLRSLLVIATITGLAACGGERTTRTEAPASSPSVSSLVDLPRSWIYAPDGKLVDGCLVIGVLLPWRPPVQIAELLTPGELAALRSAHPGPGDPDFEAESEIVEYEEKFVIRDTAWDSGGAPHGGPYDRMWPQLLRVVRETAARITARTGFEVLVREVLPSEVDQVPLLLATPDAAHGPAANQLRRYVDRGGLLVLTHAREEDLTSFGHGRVGPRVPMWEELAPLDHPFVDAVAQDWENRAPSAPPLLAMTDAGGRICVCGWHRPARIAPPDWALAVMAAHVVRHGDLQRRDGPPLVIRSVKRHRDDLLVELQGDPEGLVSVQLAGPDRVPQQEVTLNPSPHDNEPPSALVALRVPPGTRNPWTHHVVATWRREDMIVRRSVPLSEADDMFEQRVLAPTVFEAGGTAAVRVFIETLADPPRPIEGHRVLAHLAQDDHVVVQASGLTDVHGHVTLQIPVPGDAADGDALLRVGDRTLNVSIRRNLRACVVTDQPIYQEDARVHVRVMVHTFPDGRPAANQELLTRAWDGVRPLGELTVRTSAFGIGAGSLDMKGVSPGRYRIEVCTIAQPDEAIAETSLRISAFERASFRVVSSPRRIVVKPGSVTPAVVRAEYMNGAPLVGGSVRFEGEALLVRGWTDRTDGRGEVHFSIDAKRQTSALPELTAVVRDADGQTIRCPLAVVIEGRRDVSVVLTPQVQPVVGVAGPVDVAVRCGGRPGPGQVVITQGTDASCRAELDSSGRATCQVTPVSKDNLLEVRVRLSDGTTTKREQRLPAVSPTASPVVVLDRLTWHAGAPATGRVYATDGVAFVDLLRGHVLLDSVPVVIDDGRGHFTIPLRETHIGEVVFAAHRVDGLHAHGTQQNALVLSSRRLDIDARPAKSAFAPGTAARVDVQVRDAAGRPTAAALGYWAVDQATLEAAAPSLDRDRSFRTIPQRSKDTLVRLVNDLSQADGSKRADGATARWLFGWVTPLGKRNRLHRLRDRRSAGLKRERTAVILRQEAALKKRMAAVVLAALHAVPTSEVRSATSFRELVADLVGRGDLPRTALVDAFGLALTVRSDDRSVCFVSAGGDGRFETLDDVVASYPMDRFVELIPPRIQELLSRARADGTRWFLGPDLTDILRRRYRSLRALGGGSHHGRRFRSGRTVLAPRPPVHRRDFSPSLVFVPEILTDADGRAAIDVPLNDALTTWRLKLSATAASGAIGTGAADLRVAQPLHVKPRIASPLTVGDAVSVPVAVRNETNAPMTVEVLASVSDASTVALVGPPSRTVEVSSHQTGAVTFRLRANAAGTVEVRIEARSGSLVDAYAAPVVVAPLGRAVENSTPLTAAKDKPARLEIDVGSSTPGATLQLVVWPDTASAALDGLDGLLQRPTGCCEQTATTMLPMAIATDRLQAAGRLTKQQRQRAKTWLTDGRNRILGFEVATTGGFSLYGHAPADPAVTAYALLALMNMRRHTGESDSGAKTRALEWLAKTLDGDGAWSTRGATPGTAIRTTAYVAGLLALAGERPPRPALAYLDRGIAGCDDAYTLALAAIALHGEGASVARVPGACLASRVLELGERAFDVVGPTPFGGRGQSPRVIAIALACEALRLDGRPEEARRTLDWLRSARDARGRFGSTQATFFALYALAGMAAEEAANATVRVSVDGGKAVVGKTTFGQPLRLDLPGPVTAGRHLVEVATNAKAAIRSAVVVRRWAPWSETPLQGNLNLTVAWPKKPVPAEKEATCRVVVHNLGTTVSSAPILTLGLPPGIDVDPWRVRGPIARAEKSRRGLILYLADLAAGERLAIDVPFRPRYALSAHTRFSELVAPYTPESAAIVAPSAIEVR
ncbi:MAG: hypothetical protein CMJ83_07775 [Planctomycetes bacterium]|nr:hypothetical protein [Planctomycetota bacterium]